MNFTRLLILCALGLASIAFAQTAGVDSPQGDLYRVSNGSFYGTSAQGGLNNQGAIFRVTPESEVSVAVNFTGDAGTTLGAVPRAGLVDDGTGVLWGTTVQGGTSGLGTVFKFVPATGALTTVIEFTGTNGSFPEGALASDGAGTLWGTTREGGTNDLGTVFTINTTNGALTTVITFTGSSGAAIGAEPRARLVRDGAGFWWGTTAAGGVGELGTVFSIDPANSNAFTSEVIFTGTNGAKLGSAPEAGLTVDANGKLWGTTTSGGTSDKGTAFRFDPSNDLFTTLVNFDGTNGSYPKAVLREESGFMWGTTFAGGTADIGTIFTIATADDAYALVASFTGTSGAVHGAYPVAALVPGAPGELWGVTSQGGTDDRGTIFKVLTATKTVLLVAEPELAPVAPTATVQKPPSANGPLGTPVTLRGTAKDNFQLVSVVVSINGGPFLPATLTAPLLPGKPFTWAIDVIPENGINVVIIKSVDNGGNPAKPVKLTFNYTVTRADIAGNYTGLITPDAILSTTPLLHSGVFKLKVTAKGRFTGKLTLGGRPLPLVLSGSIGNTGAARFGKTGLELLTIPRKNQTPLTLSLHLDADAPFSRQVTGCLHENGVMLGIVAGGQMLYTAKLNPLPPLQNVPTSLLDPATDKGSYTALLRALTPAAQGLPATDFPQGDGYAVMKLKSNGSVKITGKLPDGTTFTASNSLTADNMLPVFAKLYTGTGAIVGPVVFRDVPLQSDADCVGMLWFRPANPKTTNYRNGWPTGIQTDFFASRFVAPLLGGATTALGNTASTGSANALVTLTDGNLPGQLDNLLAIPAGGLATILGAPGGGTAPAGLKFSLLKSGLISGSFTHPAATTATVLSGAVLQKTQTGGGYFLAAPVGGVAGDPKQSGRVELSAQ